MGEMVTQTPVMPWEHVPHEGDAPDRLTQLADDILLRCRGEGPANCVARCPLHVDARGYIQLIREGMYREGLQLIRDKLPFPGILGYVCTHPCERHCKNIDLDGAIRIRDLKRFLVEWEPGEPQHVLDRQRRQLQKVAVIGSGPAGLIAAHDLARRGYGVTLFEREASIGGCLVYKIPPWRLPPHVVARDLSIITALGIEIRTRICIGRDISLTQLRQDYQAILLLCGYEGGLDLLRGGELDLSLTVRDTIWADAFTCETGVPGVFAGGEAVSGPGAVIDALALGRRCAESAHCHMIGRDLHENREGPLPHRLLWTLEIDETERSRRERRPMMLQPYNEPLDEAEAQKEAERCLGCECGICVEECEFLAQHCHSPKGLALRVKNSLEKSNTLKMIYSCNLCSLCDTVCPEGLGTGELLLEARREAVKRGVGPLPEHRSVIRQFNRGVSQPLSLLMPEPGRSRSKRLFFTGCTLPSMAPRNTIRVYDELRKHYRGTGVLMHCCGAPVNSLGMDDVFADAKQQLLRMVEGAGAEELITACPSCVHTLKEHLPELRITSVWELLAGILEPPVQRKGVAVSIHDACKARHESDVHSAIRYLLNDVGSEIKEVDFSGALTRCCGVGGRSFPVDPALSRRISKRRAAESPLPMITYCAECRMALAGCGKESVHILDFLFSEDWLKAANARVPGGLQRYVNRLRCKSSFKRLRPLGTG
jgi:glutamate synthase (NADPH/NADH) small chain